MAITLQHKHFVKPFCPFIKWVGGKRGLLSQLILFFPAEFENYHEPFLGGGAVFFELYNRGMLKDKKIFLSDINEELINAYIQVKENPEKLINELKKYKKEHSKDFYYITRSLDREANFKKISSLKRAARFIYLNKTCFNGLYRVNAKGYFNVPMGSYKNPNIADEESIYRANEALQNATIKCQSFTNVLNDAKGGDFVYFDPPYYPLTTTANFTAYNQDGFLEAEQNKLFEVFRELDDRGCKVAQSNSDTEFIKELYKNFKINTVMTNRFINSKSDGRGKIKEVLIRN
ncbi:MAG: DNA adenine methylase [Campylobacterales bacterium]|nr:DNA adenine methylase [Campylobacterales bacterium]